MSLIPGRWLTCEPCARDSLLRDPWRSWVVEGCSNAAGGAGQGRTLRRRGHRLITSIRPSVLLRRPVGSLCRTKWPHQVCIPCARYLPVRSPQVALEIPAEVSRRPGQDDTLIGSVSETQHDAWRSSSTDRTHPHCHCVYAC